MEDHDVDIAIVGAGITGLSLAFWIGTYAPHMRLMLIEKEKRLGGWVHTAYGPSGQLYEKGPHSIRLIGKRAEAFQELIQSLSLENEIIRANKEVCQRKYVLLDNFPQEVPSGSFFSLLTQPLGRRLLREICKEPVFSFFQARACEQGRLGSNRESIEEFIERRFRSPLLHKLANALTGGIWACEAKHVSLQTAFPHITALDRKYRSLFLGGLFSLGVRAVRALFSRRRMHMLQEATGLQGVISFSRGLQRVIDALERALACDRGVCIKKEARVYSLKPSLHKGWRLGFSCRERKMKLRAKHVVIACDPHNLPEEVRYALSSVHLESPENILSYASARDLLCSGTALPAKSSVVSVSFGWKKDLFETKRKVLPAFGILAPQEEDGKVLGIIFDSWVFPNQTITMKTRMSIMMGGTRWPDVLDASQEQLMSLARRSVREWLGISETPDEAIISSCPLAITLPLPERGLLPPYLTTKEGLKLSMVSSSIGGVSLPECVDAAQKLAKAIIG